MRAFFIALAIIGIVSFAAPTAAELNVPVATRVISFLQLPPSGPIQAAIIFAPGNEDSVAEAAAIERAIGASKGRLRTRRITANALAGLPGAQVAFVTVGLRAEQDEIAQAATRAHTVTITSDQSCVTSGRCVVAIATSPRVQITVNRAAARAVDAKFGSAFLMLVKEI